jgi:hypothetical protein
MNQLTDLSFNPMYASMLGAVLVLFGLAVIILRRRRPQTLDSKYYQNEWKVIEKKLPKKDLWALAIIDADKLLDHALKARRYKGKTMGERLVSAQHDLTDNGAIWFAHKLRNKLVHEKTPKLTQRDVKNALLGLRGALKDLGAL